MVEPPLLPTGAATPGGRPGRGFPETRGVQRQNSRSSPERAPSGRWRRMRLRAAVLDPPRRAADASGVRRAGLAPRVGRGTSRQRGAQAGPRWCATNRATAAFIRCASTPPRRSAPQAQPSWMVSRIGARESTSHDYLARSDCASSKRLGVPCRPSRCGRREQLSWSSCVARPKTEQIFRTITRLDGKSRFSHVHSSGNRATSRATRPSEV